MTRSLKSWSRRAVLFGAVAMAFPAAASVQRVGQLLSPSRSEARQRADMLLKASTRCRRSAARAGRHYLRAVPQEHSIDTLVALILQRLPHPDDLIKERDVERIRGEILRSVREDFARGHTSRVQGWVLARTEARLAALAVLV